MWLPFILPERYPSLAFPHMRNALREDRCSISEFSLRASCRIASSLIETSAHCQDFSMPHLLPFQISPGIMHKWVKRIIWSSATTNTSSHFNFCVNIISKNYAIFHECPIFPQNTKSLVQVAWCLITYNHRFVISLQPVLLSLHSQALRHKVVEEVYLKHSHGLSKSTCALFGLK